jgi:hypothetical protein
MFSNTIVKNECSNPMIETSMEERTSILVHLESIIATVLSLVVAKKNLRVDVKVEETKVTIMEE